MTKDGDKEAKIVVLVPMGMDELPVLPLDVFGPGLEELPEEPPDRTRRKRPAATPRSKSAWQMLDKSGIKIASVSARMRMVEDMLIDRMDLQKSLKAVREVVDREFYGWLGANMYDFGRFMRARFKVDELQGTRVSGRQILRFLGYRPTYRGFMAFMIRFYPKSVADRMLTARGVKGSAHPRPFQSRRHDILRSLEMTDDDGLISSYEEIADESWWSVLEQPSGPLADVPSEGVWPLLRENAETASPYEMLVEKRWIEELKRLLNTLSPKESRILRWHFGLDDEDELSLKEIGDKYFVSRERIRQLELRALAKIRRQIRE
jgi:RNA polymerase sigma factor (sigma-70 family)